MRRTMPGVIPFAEAREELSKVKDQGRCRMNQDVDLVPELGRIKQTAW